MRFFISSLALAAVVLSLAACTGKSSSDQSNATATSGAEATAAASEAAAPVSSGSSEVPTYPGATTQASGSSSNMMAQSASGTVMSTADSFDTVYAWYQKNMPAGSEKAHITSPTQSAVFMVGEPGKGQTSVTITTNAGKTVISVAHVKM
jgi:hypothetical protein